MFGNCSNFQSTGHVFLIFFLKYSSCLAQQQEHRGLEQGQRKAEQAQEAGHHPVDGVELAVLRIVVVQHIGGPVGVEAGLDDVDGGDNDEKR